MRPSLAILASAAFGAACGAAKEAPCATSLVDHLAWKLVPESGGEAGDKGPCGPNDVTFEFFGNGVPSVSVDTRRCSRATLEQPTLVPTMAGETLQLTIYHYAITSTASGDGLMTLAFGDRELWRETVPLPAEGRLIESKIVLPAAADAGAPIRWHVENHGDNTWHLVEASVMRTCPEVE